MFFSKIINLESRKDRWNRMHEYYVKQSKLKLERFDAIKIKDSYVAESHLSPRGRVDFKSKDRVQHQAISGYGAIGCALSHLHIWQLFLQSDAKYCVVLEDDLNSNHAYRLDASIEKFKLFTKNEEPDIFLLGWCGSLPPKKKDDTLIVFPSSRGYSCTSGYIVNRHAAEILSLYAYPIEMQVDFAMQAIADKFHLKVKATSKNLCLKQVLTGSDVFTTCFLCEPLLIYILISVLSLFSIYLYFKN